MAQQKLKHPSLGIPGSVFVLNVHLACAMTASALSRGGITVVAGSASQQEVKSLRKDCLRLLRALLLQPRHLKKPLPLQYEEGARHAAPTEEKILQMKEKESGTGS